MIMANLVGEILSNDSSTMPKDDLLQLVKGLRH